MMFTLNLKRTRLDLSEGYIAFARAKVDDPRVRFQVGEVQDLPLDTEARRPQNRRNASR